MNLIVLLMMHDVCAIIHAHACSLALASDVASVGHLRPKLLPVPGSPFLKFAGKLWSSQCHASKFTSYMHSRSLPLRTCMQLDSALLETDSSKKPAFIRILRRIRLRCPTGTIHLVSLTNRGRADRGATGRPWMACPAKFNDCS